MPGPLPRRSTLKMERVMEEEGFKGLKVWQRSKDLAVSIYRISLEGALSRDYGLKDQLRRAAVSIASNLAEGDERDTDKDAVRFFWGPVTFVAVAAVLLAVIGAWADISWL